MIDKHSRQLAAEALRSLMEGRITNKEYERRYPRTKHDPAPWEVFVQVWFCYSDVKTHFLTGEHIPNDERRAFLERCILFLQSDFEFQWPRQKFRPWYGLLRFFGFGRSVMRWEEEEWRIGDRDVWPFLKREQYEWAKGSGRSEAPLGGGPESGR